MSAILQFTVFLLATQIAVPSGTTLYVTNTYGERVDLWFKPEVRGFYSRPPLSLAEDGAPTAVVLNYTGKTELVARDSANRDTYLGVHDLVELARVAPRATIYLDANYVREKGKQTKQVYQWDRRTKTETILKPVREERIKTEIITDPQTGTVREVTVPYSICKMVPEQRMSEYWVKVPIDVTQEYEVTVKTPSLKMLVDGQLIPVSQLVKTSTDQ